MKKFDKLFESTKSKIQINESKYGITDIKTPVGKKIYTILNDAKMDIKTNIEKLFKKSDENRGVISNTVLQEMPDFIDLVAKLERTSTLKDSFDSAEVEIDEPEVDDFDDTLDDLEDDIDDESTDEIDITDEEEDE